MKSIIFESLDLFPGRRYIHNSFITFMSAGSMIPLTIRSLKHYYTIQFPLS